MSHHLHHDPSPRGSWHAGDPPPAEALAAALAAAPEPGRPGLLALHWAGTDDGALIAEHEPVDPDAWSALGVFGTLAWLTRTAGLAPRRLPPPAGFVLLLPSGGPLSATSWAADRYGGVYQLPQRALPGQPLVRWDTRLSRSIPRQTPLILGRALAALALAAAGHHPWARRRGYASALLLGGDDALAEQLHSDLRLDQNPEDGQDYVLHHAPDGPTGILIESWAGAGLAIVAPDAVAEARALPLHPGVLLVESPESGPWHAERTRRNADLLRAAGLATRREAGHWTVRWLPTGGN